MRAGKSDLCCRLSRVTTPTSTLATGWIEELRYAVQSHDGLRPFLVVSLGAGFAITDDADGVAG